MLAITNLAGWGIGVGGFFIDVYATYLVVAWAYRDEDDEYTPPLKYDENSYH